MSNKLINLLMILLISVFFLSCEEDFSPFGDFREKYVLTCILRSDTTFQIATLSSSYFTGTINPDDNETDLAVKFADIRVWYEDSVYLFRDSSIVRVDTSRYTTQISFYFSNRFKITPNKPIEIEVLMQNGKRLKAASVTPKEVNFSNQSSVLIPPVTGNLINVILSNGSTGTFYQPKLYFRYQKRINNITTYHEMEIPSRYSVIDGIEEPVYPVPSNKQTLVYNMDVINKTMAYLSASEPEDVIFSIYENLIMKLVILDENLTRYVSSTSQSFDDLTVRVNENDYSNVEGGLGIFGSYIIKEYDRLRFRANFITSFGYNFIKEN